MDQPNDTRSILDSIRRIVQVLQNHSKSLEVSLGISGAQLFVLKNANQTGPISINELAERTHTHQSSVSVVVDKLFEKKLIRRNSDPKDRRKVLIDVSPLGKKLLANSESTPQEKLTQGILKFPKAKRHSLAILLQQMLITADFSQETPHLFFEEKPKKGRT